MSDNRVLRWLRPLPLVERVFADPLARSSDILVDHGDAGVKAVVNATHAARVLDARLARDLRTPDQGTCATPRRCTSMAYARCRAKPCGWEPPF